MVARTNARPRIPRSGSRRGTRALCRWQLPKPGHGQGAHDARPLPAGSADGDCIEDIPHRNQARNSRKKTGEELRRGALAHGQPLIRVHDARRENAAARNQKQANRCHLLRVQPRRHHSGEGRGHAPRRLGVVSDTSVVCKRATTCSCQLRCPMRSRPPGKVDAMFSMP